MRQRSSLNLFDSSDEVFGTLLRGMGLQRLQIRCPWSVRLDKSFQGIRKQCYGFLLVRRGMKWNIKVSGIARFKDGFSLAFSMEESHRPRRSNQTLKDFRGGIVCLERSHDDGSSRFPKHLLYLEVRLSHGNFSGDFLQFELLNEAGDAR